MNGKDLTEKERYTIEVLLKKKTPVKEIAHLLDCAFSTVYKEIKSGSCYQWDYKTSKDKLVYLADVGQRKYEEKQKQKGVKQKKFSSEIFEKIESMLYERISPKVISYRLQQDGVNISFKTIYNYIHQKKFDKFTEKDFLNPHKKKKKFQKKRVPRNHRIHNMINERSEEVADRNRFGDWELDTIESGHGDKTTILAFTERATRLELFFKVSGKTIENTEKILDRIERKLTPPVFRQLFHTITCDNGVEFASPESIEGSCINQMNRTTLYYCHPYSSWERGSNENGNKFVRRFIPKGDFIKLYNKDEIKQIQDFANFYERGIFGMKSAFAYCMDNFPEEFELLSPIL